MFHRHQQIASIKAGVAFGRFKTLLKNHWNKEILLHIKYFLAVIFEKYKVCKKADVSGEICFNASVGYAVPCLRRAQVFCIFAA